MSEVPQVLQKAVLGTKEVQVIKLVNSFRHKQLKSNYEQQQK